MRDPMWVDDANVPSTSNPLPRIHESCSAPKRSGDNVFNLLARREITPRTKRSTKRLWGESSQGGLDALCRIFEAGRDSRHSLISWVEAQSLHHLSAKYCPLVPPPRSTIAAAFSPDGKTLASTHGDHTVKIIDCQSGNCLKVLSGHRRTPWVVRFHPTCTGLLASGSLDHEVRLWDANTAECVGSRDFYRPIASIAFHAQGELLAVASGHKLYIWHYNERGDMSIPTVVLKTRRSLRAVHFHPHAAPFLLTAEVNDLDSSDSSMTLATSQGYVQYPPPTVYVANVNASEWSSSAEQLPVMSLPFLIWPPLSRNDGRISFQHSDGNAGSNSMQQRLGPSSVRLLTYSTPSGQYELLLSPIESSTSSVPEEMRPDGQSAAMEAAAPESVVDAMETSDVQPEERNTQFFPFGDPAYWDLPFLQGWLIGQSQAGQRMIRPVNSSSPELSSVQSEMLNQDPTAASAMQMGTSYSRSSSRSISRQRSSRSRAIASASTAEGAVPQDQGDPQPVISRIQSELATSLAAAAAAELPCTVKLRIWPYDIKDPCAHLEAEKCRLTIPHAVLCSEMGAHFSPCGRFLAACVACMMPQAEGESGTQMQAHHDASGAATSPTRHPISSQPVMYELRIYSLEEATFGLVLASRAIRAAHCLTSIQFSPTSEHLLLAYGRRHNSLLKSIVFDGETTVPIYTILEVYRVSDMELVRVLPSAEDEVNVACFHPSVGSGLVYGTKEGKLRILQFDSSNSLNCTFSCFPDESLLEVPSHALEC
ncbi:Activating molecule in BECN1-regulated autophagy protein 1 [Bienertia sinuspersici]